MTGQPLSRYSIFVHTFISNKKKNQEQKQKQNHADHADFYADLSEKKKKN